MNILVLITILVYVVLALFFTFSFRNSSGVDSFFEPSVSVVVAARDEAHNLEKCLSSIKKLQYPREKLELIVVDDNSSDASVAIIDRIAENSLFRCIRLKEDEKTRPGKAGAILEGIEQSKGEIIFITDADCRVPKNWLRTLLRYFAENVGLVGGFTLYDQRADNTSRWGKIQSCDLSFLSGIAAAAARLQKPVSWLGNNLAFRRQAYDQVGGYRALGPSLVEDFALINAITRTGTWRFSFAAHADATVISEPTKNLACFYQQRKRWASGLHQVPPFGLFVLIVAFLSHLAIIVALLLYPLSDAVLSFLLLSVADFIFLYRVLATLQRKDLLRFFFGFELLYFSYTLLLPILRLFDRKILWKNDSYDRGHISKRNAHKK